MEIGLSPDLGIMHADVAFRPSLAADPMEPRRPHIERQTLELPECSEFGEREFFDTRKGHCRLVPPLMNEVTGTLYFEIPDVRQMMKRVGRQLTM